MKNTRKLLAKSILIPLGFTVAATATNVAIQKKKKFFFWIRYDNIDNFKLRNG